MAPQVNPSQDSQRQSQNKQVEQRFDGVLSKLVAPAITHALDLAGFGPGCAAVRAVFLENPSIFDGIVPANGTNLPSLKSLLADAAIADKTSALAA
jgi:hypothetical protein